MCKTRSKDDYPIKWLKSDYRSKLEKYKANKWIEKKEITFKPLASYFQKKNSIFEQIKRTIIDMTRVIIFEKNIDNNLWPELVLTMTYVKNSWLIKTLQNLSSYKAFTWNHSNILHLWVLGSTVYVFLHKEEQLLKLEKCVPKALKRILVSYNGYTIYWIHIKE